MKKCENREKKPRHLLRNIVLLLAAGGVGLWLWCSPSDSVVIRGNGAAVELRANRFGHLLRAEPLNRAGRELLRDVRLKGSSLDSAVDRVAGAMGDGVPAEDGDRLQVAVKSGSEDHSAQMEQQLATRAVRMMPGGSWVTTAHDGRTAWGYDVLEALEEHGRYDWDLAEGGLWQEEAADDWLDDWLEEDDDEGLLDWLLWLLDDDDDWYDDDDDDWYDDDDDDWYDDDDDDWYDDDDDWYDDDDWEDSDDWDGEEDFWTWLLED